ncbi:nucleotidyltransferase family protein [Shewanella woodyi]|uniref:nucleotidyltransferase family protein n=1 Tax=Shewanella woodyi TaxID=60961 RepID=UPI0009EE4C33|nr:nucleotidyltransferase family protein [Shewanella woodyi]
MTQARKNGQDLFSHELTLIDWIMKDPIRMRALTLIRDLNLPQGMIAAGFVRNLVWDRLHGYEQGRALTDIDVIYFEPNDTSVEADKAYEMKLKALAPELPWSVKNQARMHISNGDPSYGSSLDAMSYWPEQETAVGVYLQQELTVVSAFGFDSLFLLKLTPNPKRDFELFEARVAQKSWLTYYPKLEIS